MRLATLLIHNPDGCSFPARVGTLLCLVWLAIAVIGADSTRGAYAQDGPADLATSADRPATLTVWNREIVELRARVGPRSPAERAASAVARINQLRSTDVMAGAEASPATVGNLTGFFVLVNNHIVFALVPDDLDAEEGISLEALARRTAERLTEALNARLEQRSLPDLFLSIAVALVATAALAAVFVVATRINRRSILSLARSAGERTMRVRGVDLAPYLRAIQAGAIRATSIGVAVVAAYIWLTVVLLQFPYTRPWGENLGQWLADLLLELVDGGISALPGLFTVIVIFLATRIIVRIVNRFFRSVEDASLRVDWLSTDTARATRRIVVGFIWVFALTVAFPYIPGSGSDAFRGIGVLLGLMVSIGSAGFVNQAMSGLVLVYSRSLKPGEFVSLGDVDGRVTEVGILSTKLVTPIAKEVTIPNAVVVSSKVVNHSRLASPESGSIITTSVTIGYDTPWRQVHAMLAEAARRTSGARPAPAPTVLQWGLGDFYVEYQLIVSIDHPETYRLVLSELRGHIQDVFNENGVQIMSPHFVAQPDRKIYVPREDWYPPPATPPNQG